MNTNVSTKSRLATLLFALILGGLGGHRWYVGKQGTALLQIICWVVFPVLFVWVWIDIIMIIAGSFKDKQGLPIKNWNN